MELESKNESIKSELVDRSMSPEGKVETKGETAPPLRVRGTKQTTNIQFIVEILKKAKTLNYKPQNSEEDIFKIDDFLVEMAVLKTNKKMYSEHVYFFKVKTEKQKWE